MARPKKKEWTKGDLKLFEIDHLYPERVMNDILDRIRIRSETGRRDIATAILNIAGLLNAEIYFRKRPTSGSKRTALEDVRKKLTSLRDSISVLDDDTRDILVQAAGDCNLGFYLDSAPRGKLGEIGKSIRARERYRNANNYLDAMHGWIGKALAELGPPSKGRPPLNAEKEAIRKLFKIWKNPSARPHDATGMAFYDFVQSALLPVLNANDESPDLRAAIRYVQENPNE